ncbi:hypothetical protein HanRHA438_Chr00c02g0843681 [Helianthus annuus]|nr:hypothetical protein HanRHA438_Chr00c02g0843681 [Helianthus annuus]
MVTLVCQPFSVILLMSITMKTKSNNTNNQATGRNYVEFDLYLGGPLKNRRKFICTC